MTEDEPKRRALLKVSIPALETLFGGECRIDRVLITDDDAINNTITLLVADHPDLPISREGWKLPFVQCQMHKDTETGRIWPRFNSDK